MPIPDTADAGRPHSRSWQEQLGSAPWARPYGGALPPSWLYLRASDVHAPDAGNPTRVDMECILRNALGLTTLVILMLAGVVISIPVMALSPDGVGRRISNACFWTWSRWMLRAFGVRVWVRGPIDRSLARPCVIAPNHRSLLDVPVLGAALQTPMCAVYKMSLGTVPLLGLALWLSRSVGIRRDDARDARRRLAALSARLRSGRSILMFPEGRRSTGPLGAFKKGAAVVAIEQGVPLLPVTITGTDHVFPPGAVLVRAGDVVVTVHPVLQTKGLPPEERDGITARLHTTIAATFQPGAPDSRLMRSAVRVL